LASVHYARLERVQGQPGLLHPLAHRLQGLLSLFLAFAQDNAYSGLCRTVIPFAVGQRSNFCRTGFRFLPDSVPGSVGQF